jgi:hypothetical protein
MSVDSSWCSTFGDRKAIGLDVPPVALAEVLNNGTFCMEKRTCQPSLQLLDAKYARLEKKRSSDRPIWRRHK